MAYGVQKHPQQTTGYTITDSVISDGISLSDDDSQFNNTTEGQVGLLTLLVPWLTSLWMENIKSGICCERRTAENKQAQTSNQLQISSEVLILLHQYDIFSSLVNICIWVPACFKAAIIIPVPKKSNVSCLLWLQTSGLDLGCQENCWTIGTQT